MINTSHSPALLVYHFKQPYRFSCKSKRKIAFMRKLISKIMFVTGKDEDATDCLKSIMAIYLFRHEIKSQAEKGIDFRNSLVVPEVDADTKEKLHQREDHNHLLKRIVGCLREG